MAVLQELLLGTISWSTGCVLGALIVILPQVVVFTLVYVFPSLRKREVWAIHRPWQIKVCIGAIAHAPLLCAAGLKRREGLNLGGTGCRAPPEDVFLCLHLLLDALDSTICHLKL